MCAIAGMTYTVNVTNKAPTAELMGPKKGKTIAKNQIGSTTGIRITARSSMLLEVWNPVTFSQTKYSGVQAKPKVMN